MPHAFPFEAGFTVINKVTWVKWVSALTEERRECNEGEEKEEEEEEMVEEEEMEEEEEEEDFTCRKHPPEPLDAITHSHQLPSRPSASSHPTLSTTDPDRVRLGHETESDGYRKPPEARWNSEMNFQPRNRASLTYNERSYVIQL
uniref:Uncharacterized protein n=1 Tax=Vespula pensylvanica TaxID=30213 RepID=A0A834JLP8_VESPE|nr:hypothetical protein H0235_017896 [Vespula pensylvanica]